MKKALKQPNLFDGRKSMTLMDCLRESGRLRRQQYAKQMAYAAQQAKADETGQRCTTDDDVVQVTAHDYVHSDCAREEAKEPQQQVSR